MDNAGNVLACYAQRKMLMSHNQRSLRRHKLIRRGRSGGDYHAGAANGREGTEHELD